MSDEYKDIEGYFGAYKINKYGEIISYNRYKEGKIKKQTKNPCGYMQVCLSFNGKSGTFLVHRIVAKTFFGNNDFLQVNHKDGNKQNNNVENLEWVTHQ